MQPSPRPASSSTRPPLSPNPRHIVNTQTSVLDTVHGRILCIADIRGRLSALNDLAREANAKAIIHTGDFGFFEEGSLNRINDRTLRHLTMYSPLIPSHQRNHLLATENPPSAIRSTLSVSLLSEFPLLVSGTIKLSVPVYTVWGACEDVTVLEKFRTGNTYAIDNLHVIDEATTRCIDVGGVKLRLLGLGGALVSHKMFDNGDGSATIAGGQGTMWTTALQIGELVDTAQRVYDPSETRLLVTHASPGREGLIASLALSLKADLTISAGLHFRYASSYNEFSVQSDFEGFRHKMFAGKDSFDKVWESVKGQVDTVIDDHQRVLLDKALAVVERIPGPPGQGQEEPAWKNCWNWNLCDAAYGSLILDIKDGRVSTELKSQGFNYAYRRTATPINVEPTPKSASSSLPSATPSNAVTSSPSIALTNPPTKGSTPVPHERPLPPHLTKERIVTPPAPKEQKSANRTPEKVEKAEKDNKGGEKDKGEKEKPKKNNKKDKREKEKDKADTIKDTPQPDQKPSSPNKPQPQPGKTTPVPSATATSVASSASTPAPAPVPSNPPQPSEPAKPSTPVVESGPKSPISENGARRPQRNPYTLLVKMHVPTNEQELREFFGEAKSGITRVHYPAGRPQKLAYVDFGDEEALKAGLEKHAEKLKDTVPEIKQVTDDRPDRGSFRGRGRGGRGGFVARGLAAAGLTKRTNGEATSAEPNT